jgi:hypothetical protein
MPRRFSRCAGRAGRALLKGVHGSVCMHAVDACMGRTGAYSAAARPPATMNPPVPRASRGPAAGGTRTSTGGPTAWHRPSLCCKPARGRPPLRCFARWCSSAPRASPRQRHHSCQHAETPGALLVRACCSQHHSPGLAGDGAPHGRPRCRSHRRACLHRAPNATPLCGGEGCRQAEFKPQIPKQLHGQADTGACGGTLHRHCDATFGGTQVTPSGQNKVRRSPFFEEYILMRERERERERDRERERETDRDRERDRGERKRE